jgi:acetyltransferase-like isoleucine patch superfamily enzyme
MTDLTQEELLEEFAELVWTDRLPTEAWAFLGRASALADRFLETGELDVPEDPFRGGDREMAERSDLAYVMFWRMFDRSPLAMMQGFAIPLRRILAQRIFRRCGEGVVIHHDVLFSSGRNIELGDRVFLNRGVMLDDRDRITIGALTAVAAGVTIETHGHVYDDLSKPIMDSGRTQAPVSVGADCILGYNAVVHSGVTIGDRCIVASNSVVTKDVPDRTIVGGVPAREIKRIEP